MPAQQGRRLDEDVPETPVGEQSYQTPPGPRLVGEPQHWSVDLVSKHRHLAAATGESNELEDTAERPVEEREGHRRMLAASDARGQTAGHGPRMAFSAPKVPQGNDEQESK